MITVFTITSTSGTGRYSAHLAGELAKYRPVTLVAPAFDEYRALLRDVGLREIVKLGIIRNRALRALAMIYVSFSPIRHFAVLRRHSDLLYFVNAGHWPQMAVYLLAAKLLGYRTALLVHDVWPHRPLLPSNWRGIERACLRWIYGRADQLVVHHAGAAAELAALGLKASGRVAVIPHGLFDLAPAEAPEQSADLRLMLFGQIRENKNILPAIRAVQRLRTAGHRVRLTIRGKASARESAYLARCREAIAVQPDGITLDPTFVPEGELPAVLASCDAFLLPYSDFHSQSGVAMLALANGKAILASRAGGLGELLNDGKTGLAIDAPIGHDNGIVDEDAIAATIRRAEALGRAELARLGDCARARLAASSSWEVVGRQHASMLDSLAVAVTP
jgi:glycosyltransferase involved in cell wall biosynthesis